MFGFEELSPNTYRRSMAFGGLSSKEQLVVLRMKATAHVADSQNSSRSAKKLELDQDYGESPRVWVNLRRTNS